MLRAAAATTAGFLRRVWPPRRRPRQGCGGGGCRGEVVAAPQGSRGAERRRWHWERHAGEEDVLRLRLRLLRKRRRQRLGGVVRRWRWGGGERGQQVVLRCRSRHYPTRGLPHGALSLSLAKNLISIVLFWCLFGLFAKEFVGFELSLSLEVA